MASCAPVDLVNRMIEEIQNRRNIDLVDEIFAPDFVNHTPSPGGSGDRAGMREIFATAHTAFPDGVVVVEHQVASGDKVWTWKSFSGTHTGPLRGLAPTGNKVTYQVVDILRVQDGKITDHWGLVDRLPLMRQLGLVKT